MKMRMVAALLAVMAVVVASQASANVLKNPGFEDPTVDTGSAMGNWFRFGSGAQGVALQNSAMPHSGAQNVEILTIAASQFAGVFQDIESPTSPGTLLPISPGQSVTFSGWHKAVGDFLGTREVKFEWQGVSVPQTRIDALSIGPDYEQFSETAIAPTGTTGLRVTYVISTFGPGQGDADVFIDDFSVTVVPEPSTIGLAGVGLLALARMRRRK